MFAPQGNPLLQETTVIVRHIPRHLSDLQIEQLLQSFNCVNSNILPSRNKKTTTAFVTFRSFPEAQCAITRLHQMEIMGFRLSAEVSNKHILNHTEPRGKCDSINEVEKQYVKLIKKLNLAEPPPHLKYKYPPATPLVIINIIAALYEHTRFYTQVLHLMNKMNLECPFNEDSTINSLIKQLFLDHLPEEILRKPLANISEENINIRSHIRNIKETKVNQEIICDIPMDIEENEDKIESDEEEEELEEDEEEQNRIEETNVMLPKRRKINVIKRPKFIKPIIQQIKTDAKKSVTEKNVFEETPLPNIKQNIEFKISSDLTSITENTRTDQTLEESTSEGFGIMTPRTEQSTEMRTEEEEEKTEEISSIITKQLLDNNRLAEKDRSYVKAFNNYEKGTPSCRLYVKNLAKKVTENDLKYIYSRYFLPEFKEQGTMFDIRLMQEGRMKGQAFITLQTIEQAKRAVEETNGFILKDKPMVVQFARSMQAKPEIK